MEWKIWFTWSILYEIFKIFWTYLTKHGEKTDNPSIRIYVNKRELHPIRLHL